MKECLKTIDTFRLPPLLRQDAQAFLSVYASAAKERKIAAQDHHGNL
ncbi:MAG: hypothetical protein QG625_3623 [Cyanobacteriota bacterium erpe_2018_sw_39hr_WHONDRS-SW48-000098_B_bin.30]|nr:hypothetical protein [Cyanobacteriota bacterium erpe_2018_sw_39hr_WHONDRS-SW48-000098_B_bin.30]